MPAPNDPSLARIRISATSNGTFTTIAYVRSGELNRGSEGSTTLKWLGGQALKSGDRTLGGSFPIYWADDDTNGQQIAEAAWVSGDTVYLQYCPKGTAAGAKVKQFAAVINEAPISFDSEGDAVEGSFSFEGDPATLTEITLSA